MTGAIHQLGGNALKFLYVRRTASAVCRAASASRSGPAASAALPVGGVFRAFRFHIGFQRIGLVKDNRHLFADEFLDILQIGLLFLITERNGHTFQAGTAGSADAMNVCFRDIGQIKIHNMRHVIHINASGGDVGGNQYPDIARLELGQRGDTIVLRLVTMDGRDGDSSPYQIFCHAIRAMLGSCKDQNGPECLVLEQMGQQQPFFLFTDKINGLGDGVDGGGNWCDSDFHGLAKQFVDQLDDFRWHGCGKQHVLTNLGKHGDDPLHIRRETHVEHAVRFIQNKDFHMMQFNEFLADEIEQPARRGHKNVHALFQRFGLCALGNTAEYDRGLQCKVASIGSQAIRDLQGQLACGREDEATDGLLVGGVVRFAAEHLQNGDGKGGGFTGSGLGAPNQIPSLEQQWNGLFLNGRGNFVPLLGDRLENGGNEIQFRECQNESPSGAGTARH